MTASATIAFSHAPRGLASQRGAGLGARKRCPGLAPLGVAFHFLGSHAFHPEFTRKNFGKRIVTIFSRQPMMEFHALFRCNQASPAKFLWILRVNSKSKENVERSRAFILRSNNRNPNLTLRCRFFVTFFQSLERLVNNWLQLKSFRAFKERNRTAWIFKFVLLRENGGYKVLAGNIL